jgi:hypothetical protein
MARVVGWRRRWRPDPVTAVVVLATVVFALAGIGGPLLGLGVFADTGSLADHSGYRDVLAGVRPQTVDLRDQVDAALPNSILFGAELRDGGFAGWNPYSLGGGPLGSTPNLALGSPLSLPFWALPGWLAPAYVRVLELLCAIGATVLFLRRLRLPDAAAWMGGLVYASSAFMVAWSGWPQTRVAALVPALFWAADRVAERVRVRDVALVALVVAGLLLGGFPAVTGYALLTAGAYLLVRATARQREVEGDGRHRVGWRGGAWRPWAARVGAAGAGVAAGVALAAWQLVPWVRYMATVLITGRGQDPGDVISPVALLTTVAPYAFGTVSPDRPPDWFGPLRLIDAEAYVGAAALVLVISAVALAGTARARLPRGTFAFFLAASAGWVAAIFFGGPLLWLLQRLPYLFSDNPVGRARSVLGFTVAVLAAAGFAVLLRGRPDRPPEGRDWFGWPHWRRIYGVAVWVAFLYAATALYVIGWAGVAGADGDRAPDEPSYLTFFHGELRTAAVLLVLAGAGAAALWWRRVPRVALGPRWRAGVAAGLVLLVAGQALWWVRTYHPRTDRDAFYPTTPTQAYLAGHLGHERYFGADRAIYGSVDITARLRGFHGHGFIDHRWAELADTLPGRQFVVPTTAILSDPAGGVAAMSPVLDRAAVTHYVAPPEVPPFGPVVLARGDGSTLTLVPGRPVTVAVVAPTGPVRGVGITPAGQPPSAAAVRVVLRDAGGRVVAENTRRTEGRVWTMIGGRKVDERLLAGRPFFVPLAEVMASPGTRFTAEITLAGAEPLTVAARDLRPAVSVVTAEDDGLRLVYAAESVIYERDRALPRARWASTAMVVPEPRARVRLMVGGELTADEVLLDRPGPPAQGRPARVGWLADGTDEMALRVEAEGAGYLVLADALHAGWRVTVDGAPAPLRTADHAFVAVAVPAGTHEVRFTYEWWGWGAWLSLATALLLLVGTGIELRATRRPDGAPGAPAG